MHFMFHANVVSTKHPTLDLKPMTQSTFQEIWAHGPRSRSLCALINGDVGWLMYQREPEDAGFSSRNPDYAGPADAAIEYVLSNGQRDEYLAAWALPLPLVLQDVEYFQSNGSPPPFVEWHNDSGDGTLLGPLSSP